MLAFFDFSTLNQLPILQRGIIGGLINALPIFFAGIIVPIMLNRSTNPTISLGSDLLGAVIGGCAEHLSMYLGLQSLGLMALAIYFAAIVTYSFRSRQWKG